MGKKRHMTEEQWRAATDPHPMLAHLRDVPGGRKWRLFACACCRRIWPLFEDRRSRQAIEAAEAYASGLTPYADLRAAHEAALAVVAEATRAASLGAVTWPRASKASAAAEAAQRRVTRAVQIAGAVALAVRMAAEASGGEEAGRIADRVESTHQCRLLRCIFGNPFRPTTLVPGWLTSDVLALAQAADEERSLPAGTLEPTRLDLLADALEDAGCTNAYLLGHLRGEGPHVRCCWAVGLCLGRQ